MAGNNEEARIAADLISRSAKNVAWNCDAFLSLVPAEGGDVRGAAATAYRNQVTIANLVVMPLDEPSVETWQQADDADRTARTLHFARFLRTRYPHARALVFVVANNLVVARADWPAGAPAAAVTIFSEPRPLEELEPELLPQLFLDQQAGA